MKRLFALLATVLFPIICFSQTSGTLSISVTTSETGGNYAPKNVVAIWVEDEGNSFVKTLLAYAANRKTHLNMWEMSTTNYGSAFNVVDAITGATLSNHATRTCVWDGTDVDGNIVTDGTYYVNFELTDKNSTGNHLYMPFTKGALPETLTPDNYPSFSNVLVEWTPESSSIENLYSDIDFFYPNPTSGMIYISDKNVSEITVHSVTGQLIYSGTESEIDLGNESKGIYFVRVILGDIIKSGKIYKE